MDLYTFQIASMYRQDPYLYSLVHNKKRAAYSLQAHEEFALGCAKSRLKKTLEKVKRFVLDILHKIRGKFSRAYREKIVLSAGGILLEKQEAEDNELIKSSAAKRIQRVFRNYYPERLKKEERELVEDASMLQILRRQRDSHEVITPEVLTRKEEEILKKKSVWKGIRTKRDDEIIREEESLSRHLQGLSESFALITLKFLDRKEAELRKKIEDLDKRKQSLTVATEKRKKIAEKAKAFTGPLGKMLTDIETHIHEDVREIWEVFFSKFEVDFWNLEHGKFTLKLKKEAKLWVNTLGEDGKQNPIGGNVIILKETVKGTIDRRKKVMDFERGYENYCKNPESIGPEYADSKTFTITYNSAKNVEFWAGAARWPPQFSRKRSQTISQIKKNWAEGLVVDDHKKVIEEKVRLAKKR